MFSFQISSGWIYADLKAVSLGPLHKLLRSIYTTIPQTIHMVIRRICTLSRYCLRTLIYVIRSQRCLTGQHYHPLSLYRAILGMYRALRVRNGKRYL